MARDRESAWDAGNQGLIPGLGRSPGEGNGNPLQYSCLDNSMDGEAWCVTVHGVAKNWIQLSMSVGNCFQHPPHSFTRRQNLQIFKSLTLKGAEKSSLHNPRFCIFWFNHGWLNLKSRTWGYEELTVLKTISMLFYLIIIIGFPFCSKFIRKKREVGKRISMMNKYLSKTEYWIFRIKIQSP